MIAIVGAGGHGKCVYECLKMRGYQTLGFFDDDQTKHDMVIIDGVKALDTPDRIFEYKDLTGIFVAVGDNKERLDKFSGYCGSDLEFPNAIHIRAYISEYAHVGSGNFMMGAAVINPGSVIGNYCIINTNATVGHDCIIDDAVQIGPGVNIAGGCRLKQGAFVGVGARIVPGVTIGAWAVVGAGAVVLEDMPDYTFSGGIPAQVIRNLKQ